MLLTYIAEIYVSYLPNHRRHFSLRQVKLCIGQRKYKQKFTTQGVIDQASEFALAHLTPILHFCKIVVKTIPLIASYSKWV